MIPKELMERMVKDRSIRSEVTKRSHLLFFHFYFAHYVRYATAPFQKEIFRLTEDEDVRCAVIVAFRNSGKSTIITTSLPIWAILGKLQKKFVIVVCQTKIQAKQHMMNMREELEENALLRNDLGPFQEEGEWGSSSLVFAKLKARITVVSTEQSIRGLRHHQHRPDLIIADDLENLQSVKTREGRDGTYTWFKSELVPAGGPETKVMVIGNLLHEDSLLMRLKEDIEEGRTSGVFKMYPLKDDKDEILWPGKFPSEEAIEEERKRIGDHLAWQREFLLRILPAYDQIIRREDIHYYDRMPHEDSLQSVRIGVDLAISKKETADYTAMVTGWVHLDSKTEKYEIYIDPVVVNRRMDFTETVGVCKDLYGALDKRHTIKFLIEDVAYQRALPELLQSNDISAEAVKIGAQDKRSRLNIASHLVRTGVVKFHPSNIELVNQIIGFGVEKHDDMVDAFTILVLNVIENPPYYPRIFFI